MTSDCYRLIRHLGPSNCPFIDLPYQRLYLSDRQIAMKRDAWYDGRVRCRSFQLMKRGEHAGKFRVSVGFARHVIHVDPEHMVLM